MNLKKLFTVLSGISIGILIVLLLTIFWMFSNYQDFRQSYETRFQSLLAAKELQQTSNDLTRYCRTYIATGDLKWKEKYYELLKNHFGHKDSINQRTLVLHDKIKSMFFTEAELRTLFQIKTSSDYLSNTETKAFYAMEGIFKDRSGAFTQKRYPDPTLARQIMFDQNYLKNKVKMSVYIDDFFSTLQQRTQKQVDYYNRMGRYLFSGLIGLIILMIGLSIISFLIVRVKIGRQVKQLKESEEKYKIIFENNSDAILLIDKNRAIDCNLSALKMYQYDSKVNFLETHPSKMSPKRQLDGMLSSEKAAKMMAVAYEKGSKTFEWIHTRADGENFPTKICLTRIPYQDKGILYAVCHDLTQHKETERAFKDSEKRFELAMSVANDGIWDWNLKEGRILLDARYYTMAGYEAKEYPAVYEEWKKRIHPDDFSPIKKAMDDFVARKKPTYDVEFRFLCKNGVYLWIRSRGKIIDWDEKNRPLRIVGTHADIDAHRKAKEKLYQSEILKKTILQNIPNLMWLKDVNGIYLACNPAMEQSLNRSADNIIGRSDFDFFDPKQAELFSQQDKETLKKNQTITSEIVRLDKNQQKIRYEMTCSTVKDERGVLIGVLGTTHDITKRKQHEAALIEAQQRAETANRAKSEFLANMSHEIRTPMNAILGFTEILMRLEQDSKKVHYLETINTSGQALLRLINDILDLSRIESGKMQLQYDSVSIRNLCIEMQGLFSAKIQEKGLLFNYTVDKKLPDIIALDEARIRQVLINLIGNAIKFTHQGGITLTISTQVSKEVQSSRVNLVIVVSDTGIGIPQGQQAKIFHSFEQVQGQKETLYGGTGLGLAITMKIITLMKGNIHLESQEKKGTSFHLLIPDLEIISTQEQKPSCANNYFSTDSLIFQPSSILVVDDVDYNREILETYLSDWDFTLHFACNGQQAFDKAKEILPDLILLDMKMPVMDGYETAEKLKALPFTQKIPIIAITAFALNEDEVIISELCDAYLRKPVNCHELMMKLTKFLPYDINTSTLALQSTKTPETIALKTLF
ncbi:MAG: PAS domain S-box protein, partial [Methylococcales bacterium]|nr:PAS domain S-box protein [Methylococcales bacterium]